MPQTAVQTLLELQQLRAMPTALGRLFHVHRPPVQSLSLTPGPPLAQLHAVPAGPVAVTAQSSVLPSTPCEELQPP